MTLAIESTPLHTYRGENYLHYFGENAGIEFDWITRKTEQGRHQTLAGARAKAAATKARNLAMLSKRMGSSEIPEKIISGAIFKEISALSETAIDGGFFASAKVEEAMSEFEGLSSKTLSDIEKLQAFSEALKKAADIIYGAGTVDAIYKGYVADLILRAASKKSILKRGGENGSVAQGIIASILGRYNQDFFKIKNAGTNIENADTCLIKITAIIHQLPNLPVDAKEIEVRHNKSKQTTTTKNIDEVLKELYLKVEKFFLQYEKVTREVAYKVGLNRANYAALKTCGEFDLTSNHAQPEVKYRIDSKFRANLDRLEKNYKEITKKVPKPDVSFYFNNDGKGNGSVKSVGFLSVKEDKSIRFGADGTVSGSVKLQDGTSLLTALWREASLTGWQMKSFIQLAVSHSISDSDGVTAMPSHTQSNGDYNELWNQMKYYLSERMLYNALVGADTIGDSALFIALKGKVFSIADLIQTYINQPPEEIYASLTIGSGSSEWGQTGLTRDTYVKMNRWWGNKDTKSTILATVRSRDLERRVYSLMEQTKLRIMLNMSNLTGLKQLN